MITKIKCPVCDYPDVTGQFCPNCDSDVSIIHALMELKPYVEQDTPEHRVIQEKRKKWSIQNILWLIIIFIVGLVLGWFIFFRFFTKKQYILLFLTPPITVPPSSPTKKLYVVQEGDNITKIAKKLCGQRANWQEIIDVNPHLVPRRDLVYVGERLIIPECHGRTRGG